MDPLEITITLDDPLTLTMGQIVLNMSADGTLAEFAQPGLPIQVKSIVIHAKRGQQHLRATITPKGA